MAAEVEIDDTVYIGTQRGDDNAIYSEKKENEKKSCYREDSFPALVFREKQWETIGESKNQAINKKEKKKVR